MSKFKARFADKVKPNLVCPMCGNPHNHKQSAVVGVNGTIDGFICYICGKHYYRGVVKTKLIFNWITGSITEEEMQNDS